MLRDQKRHFQSVYNVRLVLVVSMNRESCSGRLDRIIYNSINCEGVGKQNKLSAKGCRHIQGKILGKLIVRIRF
jgi:hypothetical protein